MRMIGMLLALGAIAWVLYQAAGGGEADSVVPEAQRQAMERAGDVEQTLQDAASQRLEQLDRE